MFPRVFHHGCAPSSRFDSITDSKTVTTVEISHLVHMVAGDANCEKRIGFGDGAREEGVGVVQRRGLGGVLITIDIGAAWPNHVAYLEHDTHPCAAQGINHRSNKSTKITFVNECDGPVEIFWQNETGEAHTMHNEWSSAGLHVTVSHVLNCCFRISCAISYQTVSIVHARRPENQIL